MLTISWDARQNRMNPARGFTLEELLVVISIIGILVALLMPAVNSARESGRRATCENNLHQLALACQAHESKWSFFPSGGWGKWWAGTPDRAPGVMQPGGWHYNILPFIDQVDLHEMGRDGANVTQGALRAQTAVALFLCPSRHSAKPFSFTPTWKYANINNPPSIIGRSDYAANAGSNFVDPGLFPLPGANNSNGTYNPNFNWATLPGTINSTPPSTGVIFRASALPAAQIKDGLSFTYLIGERFMPINSYDQSPATEKPPENDAGWDSGYDYNTIRWTGVGSSAPLAPAHDQNLASFAQQTAALFGSAHEAGFHMALCGGEVRLFSYAIDPTTHMQLGNRADGEPTDMSKADAK